MGGAGGSARCGKPKERSFSWACQDSTQRFMELITCRKENNTEFKAFLRFADPPLPALWWSLIIVKRSSEGLLHRVHFPHKFHWLSVLALSTCMIHMLHTLLCWRARLCVVLIMWLCLPGYRPLSHFKVLDHYTLLTRCYWAFLFCFWKFNLNLRNLLKRALPARLHAAGCFGGLSRLTRGLWETSVCNRYFSCSQTPVVRGRQHMWQAVARRHCSACCTVSFYRHESCKGGRLLRSRLRWQMFMQHFLQ